MSIATINQTEIVTALRKALQDYNEALAINSKIQLEIQLGHKDMWSGLCWYFKHTYHSKQAHCILDELSKDADRHLIAARIADFPYQLTTVADMRNKALAPRIALLMKTIERLNATA